MNLLVRTATHLKTVMPRNERGSIINNCNLVNAGVISNLCGGTVTGPANGNQTVIVCPTD